MALKPSSKGHGIRFIEYFIYRKLFLNLQGVTYQVVILCKKGHPPLPQYWTCLFIFKNNPEITEKGRVREISIRK